MEKTELIKIGKITKSGKYTYAISIPKEYIIENNLKIGSRIETTFKVVSQVK